MDDVPSYVWPIKLGETVRASNVSIVEHSSNPDVPVGTWASWMLGIDQSPKPPAPTG